MKKPYIIIIIALLIIGCGTTDFLKEYDKVHNPAPVIEESVKTSNEVATKIDEKTTETIVEVDKIKTETSTIEKKVPNQVDGEVKKINESADKIKGISSDLKLESGKLRSSTKKLESSLLLVKELAKQKGEMFVENKELRVKLAKANDEKQQALFHKMIYLIIASIILGAICIVSALKGEPKAIWGAVGAGVVMITALAVSFYAAKFALVGFVAIIAGLGLLGWVAYRNHVEKKATKELVHTVEVTKDKLATRDKEEIFGRGAKVGQSHIIQSPFTKKLVNDLRVEGRKDWESSVKYASK